MRTLKRAAPGTDRGMYQIGEVNKFRESQGFPPIVPKRRKCLACGKQFFSLGKNNRMCGCKQEEEPCYQVMRP